MSTVGDILNNSRTVAVVGLSANPDRPSHAVAEYLKENGYTIIPVNPNEKEILGEQSYPDINSIPVQVDVVDIFRRPEDVLPVVREAIGKGIKAVWMQEGVVNKEAAAEARKAGLKVVMDKCMFKEHWRLFSEDRPGEESE